MTPTIGILTPTIGKPELFDCLMSVYEQTHPVTHYIVADGKSAIDPVCRMLDRLPADAHERILLITLEENVGKGFYGHRVYASVPMLMNTEYVCYLDEDNWLDSTHAETLLRTVQESDAAWAYSLRMIYRPNGELLCEDICESLGLWPIIGADPHHEDAYHCDTSSFMLPRQLASQLGPVWIGGWGQDRVFFRLLRQVAPRGACSGHPTLSYRLAGNRGSVTAEFFLHGQRQAQIQYSNQDYPWHKQRRP